MLLASAYDQSRYFKAADMQAEKKLRIRDVTEEEIGVGQDKQKKLVVWFTNDQRGLVLNKTNNRTLRAAFGDNCAGWRGKIIIAYPTTDGFQGRMVPAQSAHPAAQRRQRANCCSEAEAVSAAAGRRAARRRAER
jgi:hypothetical protein